MTRWTAMAAMLMACGANAADWVSVATEGDIEHFVDAGSLATTLAEGRALIAKYPASAAVWLPGGRVPMAGERLVNHDLAQTLRAIANGGAEAFYRGDIARRIAEDMAAHGGLITEADLARYRAVERAPLRGTFRNHAVYGAPPPVASGAALIEALQILDHYAPPAPGRRGRSLPATSADQRTSATPASSCSSQITSHVRDVAAPAPVTNWRSTRCPSDQRSTGAKSRRVTVSSGRVASASQSSSTSGNRRRIRMYSRRLLSSS